MLEKVLKKIGFRGEQGNAIKNILYIIFCEKNNINFDTSRSSAWCESMKFSSEQEAYKWLNQMCQENMLRPKNVERLQYVPPQYVTKYLSEIIKYLDCLQFFNAIRPKHQKYDAMLLLGAAQESFERRVKTAIEILHNGYEVDEMYILSGSRDLWPKHEPITPILVAEFIASKARSKPLSVKEIYKKTCQIINEHLPKEVFEKNTSEEVNKIRKKIVDIFESPNNYLDQNNFPPIKWPTEMTLGRTLVEMYKIHHIIDVFDVNTPKNAQGKRPNTQDTYIQFEKEFGKRFSNKKHKPRLLLISNQPFNFYQRIIAENSLPKNKYEIDDAGDSAISITPQSIAVCLDSLARAIYASGVKF